MATSLPWSVKGVDPRTRDAAKAAARRAGMTLGEWLDHKLREETAPEASAPPEQLDIAALSERLARLSQGQMETAPQPSPPLSRDATSRHEIEAVLAQAAQIEKMTRESSAKTAGALDSIARWIETAEQRMSSGERAAAERQDRATSVIADAIKTMGERLAEIERRATEASRTPAHAPTAARREPAPRLAFSRDGLAAAVTDIRTRQRMLDQEDAAPQAASVPGPESRISALRQDLRDLSARIAPAAGRAERPLAPVRTIPPARDPHIDQIETMIANLGSKLDRLDTRDRLEPILKPLARIESEVSRLAQDRSGESFQRFELEIAHLAAKVDALTARGGDRTMLAPLQRDIAELRDVLASSGSEARLGELSQQVGALSLEIGRMRDSRPDGRELHGLTAAIDDIRDAILSDRSQSRLQDLEPLAALSLQIETLAGKLDTRSDRHIEDRIDALQSRIEQLAEKGPTAVTRQIEALAGRIENLAASSSLAHLVSDGQPVQVAQVDLRPVEEMLRNLADKIDEAGRPGADTGAFDALERQISGLAQRLDAAAATRSAESGMERTLQDLVLHLRSLREETTEAAERAARAAMTDHLDKAPPATGLSELSTLLSGLHESQASTGRETQDAIGAVHQTLETIISRLSSLEAELVADRQAAAAAPARTPMPPRVAAAERAAAKAPAGPAGLSLAMEDRIAAPERAPAPKAEPVAAAAAAQLNAALDVPLEPGSGRPRVEAAASGVPDQQSIRQNLIAAARRSAKAATEAAATAPAVSTEAPKGSSRLKEMLEKRKRPLLLGLAALVLALGTAHLVSGALKGPRTAATGEAIQSPIAPREEAPALPPAKDQSSALQPGPAAPQANTLAAAPQAAEITGSTTQPSVAGAVPVPPAVTSAPPAETVQPVTGVGELPANLGSPGMRKAALEGDARAVYELAARAADGPAATRDQKLAMRLFERAAVAGLAPAQFRLGNMFEKGIGTARDLSLARVWYTRAAERGNAKAMHNLAVLHAEGVSGKPDYASATEWFRRAAEYGVRDSQYNLAVLLGRGLGAPTDLVQSYLWFAVAAGQGDEDAGRKRDEVAQRLSPSDLATAKAETASWKPRPTNAAANEVTPPARGWDQAPTAAAPKPAAKPARI